MDTGADADALELGLPFSDPLADGPVIQAANLRVLKRKTFTTEVFALIEKIRAKYPETPIGILSYMNLAYGFGKERFFKRLSEIGVDSLLLADLSIEMIDTLRSYFLDNGISQVLIAPSKWLSGDVETSGRVITRLYLPARSFWRYRYRD